MSRRLDWERTKAKRQGDGKRRRARVIDVHPNSMAARKWGRRTWRSTST